MKHPRTFFWVWGIVLVIVAAVVLAPLFKHGFYVSDDGEWMIIRLSAFYQSLAEGQFPVRMIGRLNHSFGYPVSNFLYPGFLYIGSLIHVVGFSFVDSVKLLMGASVLVSSVFVYVSLLRWFGTSASLVGVISYLLSPYLLYDMYHRGSVGEVLAFVPATMMLYSIYNQVYWLLPLSVAFLIVSHNTLALILGIGIGLCMLRRKDTAKLFYYSIIGLGMSAFFWIPALAERHLTIFDTIAISNPTAYFIGSDNWMLLGAAVIIAVAYAFWSPHTQQGFIKKISMIILLGMFLALPLSAPLWHIPVLATLVQFPYRFLSLAVLFGPWTVASLYTNLTRWRRVFVFGVIGALFMYSYWWIVKPIVYVNRPMGYYTTNEATTTVHDEYLPRWVSQKTLYRAPHVYDFITGDGRADVRQVTTQRIDLSIVTQAPSILQINKLYYPGWGVTIDDELVRIDYSDPTGVMRVVVPSGKHHLVATFRETIPRFVADIVSLLSAVLYLFVIRRKKSRP